MPPLCGGGFNSRYIMENAESPSVDEASIDSGLNCLVIIARFHKVASDPQQLRHEFAEGGRYFGIDEILLSAKHLGLKARSIKCEFNRLSRLALPAIARRLDGSFFIIARVDEGRVLVQKMEDGRPTILDKTSLEEDWTGEVILFASRASLNWTSAALSSGLRSG